MRSSIAMVTRWAALSRSVYRESFPASVSGHRSDRDSRQQHLRVVSLLVAADGGGSVVDGIVDVLIVVKCADLECGRDSSPHSAPVAVAPGLADSRVIVEVHLGA